MNNAIDFAAEAKINAGNPGFKGDVPVLSFMAVKQQDPYQLVLKIKPKRIG